MTGARQTSIEVYRRIKAEGLLSRRRQEIYEVLFEHGPLTGNEIFKRVKGVSHIVHANIHSRLNEMEKLGVAERLSQKICSVTGNNVDLWDVTARLPVNFDKPKRLKCPHCDGKGYTETSQGRLL